MQALTLARQFDALPLAGIIYTDIARDGTLEGPNLQAIAAMAAAVRTPVIASGGVGELKDLERLATLPIAGCIVGRALYEGRFSLADAIGRSAAISSATPRDSRVDARFACHGSRLVLKREQIENDQIRSIVPIQGESTSCPRLIT